MALGSRSGRRPRYLGPVTGNLGAGSWRENLLGVNHHNSETRHNTASHLVGDHLLWLIDRHYAPAGGSGAT